MSTERENEQEKEKLQKIKIETLKKFKLFVKINVQNDYDREVLPD